MDWKDWVGITLLFGIFTHIALAFTRPSIDRQYQVTDEAHTFLQGSEDLFPTFTAEEIGKVAVSIIKGVERDEAIKAMPRYSPQQHKVYADFYNNLKAAIEAGQAAE
jgi:hypothetical protein